MQIIKLTAIIALCCGMCSAEPTGRPSWALTAKSRLGEKEKTQDKRSYRTTTEISQTAAFDIELRNLGSVQDACTIDYYFLCKPPNSESYKIFDYGNKSYSLGSMEAVKDTFTSHPVKKEVTLWWDNDKWESGKNPGGFLVVLKDRDGKILTAKSRLAKLQPILSDPEKLAAFLQQTNDIPAPETTGGTSPKNSSANMSPMMPQQEGYIRVNIKEK